MNFKDSKTYQNVMKTLEGELNASTKYMIYGEKAKEDGYQQIGNIFEETGRNEKEHAEIMMKIIYDGEIPDTLTNLKEAASGENNEWTKLYREFAEIAEQEGYKEIASKFRGIADIEESHDFRYETLADNIENNMVFCKPQEVWWLCLNCGNLYYGICAPKRCPVCGYLQGYYQEYCQNY